MVLPRAIRLHLHLPKVSVVNDSMSSDSHAAAARPPRLGHARGQLAPPDTRICRVESDTFASLLAAPMHAITPDAFSAMRVVRSPLAVRASIRSALRSSVLDALRGRIVRAADADDALPPRAGHRVGQHLPSVVRASAPSSRAQSLHLPRDLVVHPRLEPLVRRHLLGIEGSSRLRTWLRRRMTRLLEYPSADGEVELVGTRL